MGSGLGATGAPPVTPAARRWRRAPGPRLIAYGPDLDDLWRGSATYVDRILRSEKPGELPVQAPTKFDLVVNLKTAKALGLSIPPAFPLRADEVIE